jgi:hypothetical protein
MPTLIWPWYVLSARTMLCFAGCIRYEPFSAPRQEGSVRSATQPPRTKEEEATRLIATTHQGNRCLGNPRHVILPVLLCDSSLFISGLIMFFLLNKQCCSEPEAPGQNRVNRTVQFDKSNVLILSVPTAVRDTIGSGEGVLLLTK